MTRDRWLVAGGVLLVLVPWYVGAGLGYERLQRACFDSRHSLDQEPRVGDGLAVHTVDAAWGELHGCQ